MKLKFVGAVLLIAAVPLGFSACDDDEVKPSGVTFEISEQEIVESTGALASFHPDLITNGAGQEVKIKLLFDKPLPGAAVIKYKVEGTAVRDNPTGNAVNDFQFVEQGTSLTIDAANISLEKGASEAVISLTLFEDYDFEYQENALNANDIPFETVILTLESVVSGPVKLGEQTTFTLKILEDDALVFLQWDPNDIPGANAGGVDMDLLIYQGENVVSGSAEDGEQYEIGLMPAGYPNGVYGLSYVYYSGTSNELDFFVTMLNFGGTLNGGTAELEFTGRYTQQNVNKYDFNALSTKIVQNMTKSGFNYSSISAITVPASGSRMRAGQITPKQLQYISNRSSQQKIKIVKPL